MEQSSRGRTIKTTKNTQQRTSIFPASLHNALAEHAARVTYNVGADGLLFAGTDGGLA